MGPGPGVFLWFAGGAFVAVWLVFRSPAIDYRLVILGALLPLVELPIGEPRILHSLTGAVAPWRWPCSRPRRRLVQRRLVAIPIGMFVHLLLDGIWTDTEAFWWPFAGLAWSDARAAGAGPGAGRPRAGARGRGGAVVVLAALPAVRAGPPRAASCAPANSTATWHAT